MPTDLEKLKERYKGLDKRYHELHEDNSVFVQEMSDKDEEGKLYLNSFGLVKLESSQQLFNPFVFVNGKLLITNE